MTYANQAASDMQMNSLIGMNSCGMKCQSIAPHGRPVGGGWVAGGWPVGGKWVEPHAR